MTDAAQRRRRGPGPLPVIAGSLALFLAVLTLLVFQLRAGRDPAIGAGSQAVAAAPAPAVRRVVIRRVIVTRVVTRVIDDPPAVRQLQRVSAPVPLPADGRARPCPCRRAPRRGRARSGPARRAGAGPEAADHALVMTADVTFDCMGTEVRLVVPAAELDHCRAFLERYEAALSRFRPDSELCRLNAAPQREVPASPLLRTAVHAALWAAECTGGLVDPTLAGAIEAAGYDRSRRTPELELGQALRLAPARAAAGPGHRWRDVTVDHTRGTIARPPGVRLDTGGTGKGLAADLLARRLRGRWAVDCGGDMRVGGHFEIDVRHPLTGETVDTLTIVDGAVATSGLDVRLWRGPAHHLLDPATGEPAWTGLIGATALAPTALEAEALAKAALLSGPSGAGRWLRRHGGLTVRDDGAVERYGALAGSVAA